MAIRILDPIDPDGENINYVVNLSKYLQGSETIIEVVDVIISDPNLVFAGSQIINSGTAVAVLLSGGTIGSIATITVRFKVSSSPARIDDRSFRIMVEDL